MENNHNEQQQNEITHTVIKDEEQVVKCPTLKEVEKGYEEIKVDTEFSEKELESLEKLIAPYQISLITLDDKNAHLMIDNVELILKVKKPTLYKPFKSFRESYQGASNTILQDFLSYCKQTLSNAVNEGLKVSLHKQNALVEQTRKAALDKQYTKEDLMLNAIIDKMSQRRIRQLINELTAKK